MKIDTKKLKLERANQGLTYEKLAKMSGIKDDTISRIERGATKPRVDTIGKIAKALGKKIEDFII